MRYRYTLEELKEYTDYQMLIHIIIERRSDCTNVYSQLHKRLVELQKKLEDNQELTKLKVI